MVTRLLLLLVLVLAVYYLLEAARVFSRRLGAAARRGVANPADAKTDRNPGRDAVANADRLVACTVCGVHVPQARALTEPGWAQSEGPEGGGSFCSETCRQRAREAS